VSGVTEWDWLPLKRLAHISVSNVDKKSTSGESPVQLINYVDVYYGDRLTAESSTMTATATNAQLEAFHLLAGDTVITKDSESADDIGVAAYIDRSARDLVCGYHLAVIRPMNRDAHARFLYWCFLATSTIEQMSIAATGVTRFGLRSNSIRNLSIPLPPLATQKRIADFLDTETARIDALITKKRRMIELLEEQHHHYALSLLTRDSNPTVLRRLLKSPPQYGASLSGSEHEPGFVRYVRITDIDESGRLQRTNPVFLSALDAQPFLLNDDDILVARSGTIGKAFHYQSSMGPAGFAGYLIRLEFDSSKILPGLVKCWTSTSHYWTQIRESAVQSTIENVSAERYKELVVPVPPLDTQPSILKDIDDHSTRTNQLTTALTTQLALLAERRQALITAAVTGELAIPEVAA
jgi:type I restriction enzyme, S subunit